MNARFDRPVVDAHGNPRNEERSSSEVVEDGVTRRSFATFGGIGRTGESKDRPAAAQLLRCCRRERARELGIGIRLVIAGKCPNAATIWIRDETGGAPTSESRQCPAHVR